MAKEELTKLIWEAAIGPTIGVCVLVLFMFVITWLIMESLHKKADTMVSALKHIVKNWPKELIQKEIHYTTILEKKNGQETSGNHPQHRESPLQLQREEDGRSNGVVPERNGEAVAP